MKIRKEIQLVMDKTFSKEQFLQYSGLPYNSTLEAKFQALHGA